MVVGYTCICFYFTSQLITTAHIDGLVQERRNSSALAMELHLSCTDPWSHGPDRNQGVFQNHLQALEIPTLF